MEISSVDRDIIWVVFLLIWPICSLIAGHLIYENGYKQGKSETERSLAKDEHVEWLEGQVKHAEECAKESNEMNRKFTNELVEIFLRCQHGSSDDSDSSDDSGSWTSKSANLSEVL